MKTLIKVLLVQVCCLPLLITDAMARDGDKRDRGSRAPASRQAAKPAARPTARPSQSANRNPITQSKISRPSPGNVSRPATRPSFPERPSTKPAPRPSIPERPGNRPSTRPTIPDRPTTLPSTKPALPSRPTTRPTIPDRPVTLPGTKPTLPARPGERPTTRPVDRPTFPTRPETRPVTRPGNVHYPKPGKPTTLPGNINRPGGGFQKPVTRPGQNTRPIQRPDFTRPTPLPGRPGSGNNWWNTNRPGTRPDYRPGYRPGSGNHWGNNNITINNNFQNNINWSTNRNHWGYNPWWNRPATRPWYGGSWNCGWNSSYYHRHHHYYYGGYRPWPGYVVYEDNDWAKAIGWGLVGWSLGRLIFDSGYQTYQNPYPAQPVSTVVSYTEPITVVAARTAPSEEDAAQMTERSESHIADSQEAFKQTDYLRALESANKAVTEAPGDGALHEYRALVLFALGKYSEAAGVLNPVLAGGPGWDWTTMISLYHSQESYMSQLAALENYSRAKPAAADAHFLLGYHYMVCGHLDKASAEFDAAAKLQPADSVSAQLRDLTRASSTSGATDPAETPEETPPPAAPVPLEKLTGTWVSDRGAQGTVILVFKDDGKFIWNFRKDAKSNDFSGDFSMNDNGLLVLDAEGSQMVAAVTLPKESELKFVLAGGPPGDPGLAFVKK